MPRSTISDVPAPRFMLYSHDGVGLGHLRRNTVLARALTDLRPDASVLLACGVEGQETFALPSRVDVLQLPGLQKLDNGQYVGRRLPMNSTELVSMRRGILASAVEHFRPDVLVADKYPVGVCAELLPALRVQIAGGGRAALGLRDVFDDPGRAAHEWNSAGLGPRVAEFHDLVLIYGTRAMLNPLASGMLPPGVAARVRFCGYVVAQDADPGVNPADLPTGHGRPLVLAAVGGGEDGLSVLDAFIEASRGAAWQGAIVAGPLMAAAKWGQLEACAEAAGVLAYRSVQHLDRWYTHVHALVCMGGYNTLLEAVSSGTPVVCVPRTRPRSEQLIRARAFAARGLLQVVEPESLSGGRLAVAIRSALETPRDVVAARAVAALDLGGARRAAAHLLDLAERPREPAALRTSQPAREPVQVSAR